ncbi:MAG TPA: WGR domain-containing protein [Gemmatimonadales bacterium]|nr:WGR domain-containing protein [Gemmatimonadales bacterium]
MGSFRHGARWRDLQSGKGAAEVLRAQWPLWSGAARFYSLMIERDLFGRVVLVRNWGRIGTNGRELVEEFAGEIEAGQELEAVAQAKRRRGYRDL